MTKTDPFASNGGLLRVAAVQLSSQEDVKANLARAKSAIRAAAERGAKLVLLPENFAFMGPEPEKRSIAEELGKSGPIESMLAESAAASSVSVIAGGFPEASGDAERPFNTCAVFGPDGKLVTRYRKIHLFDVSLPDGTELCESKATLAGREPVVVNVGGFVVGLSICYDLRFPELYRKLVDLGAELIVVPAAFTLTTGKDHWHVLLRARAIEAQCFVMAAAQWGKHPKGRLTYGHSLIADPWGIVVAECSDGEGLAVADLDKSSIARIRGNLPSLAHRVL
jgi:predicted amidohydrolase